MGETTGISWTDHTMNPWMGCSKVSPGCDNCYAEALGKRTGRVQWGDEAERIVTSDAYWRNPLKWNAKAEQEGQRRHVFCASLADVFEDRPELVEQRGRLFELIGQTPWLDWQLLTKRPQNVMRMVPYGDTAATWLPNVWIGTTVEDQERAVERIPHLIAIPAAVRFLSCEPLLGQVNLQAAGWLQFENACDHRGPHVLSRPGVEWVICGGESGARHRALDLGHARSLRDQCAEWDVPFFFKQVGGRTPTAGGSELDGQTHKEFPHAR